KVVGAVFLGEPRTELAVATHRSGWLMVAPQIILAIGCLLVGLGAPAIVTVLVPIAAGVARLGPASTTSVVEGVTGPLSAALWATAGLIVITLGLAFLRRALLAGREVTRAGTWDCGYARPTARMQYSASSFAQPATGFFAAFLRSRTTLTEPAG